MRDVAHANGLDACTHEKLTFFDLTMETLFRPSPAVCMATISSLSNSLERGSHYKQGRMGGIQRSRMPKNRPRHFPGCGCCTCSSLALKDCLHIAEPAPMSLLLNRLLLRRKPSSFFRQASLRPSSETRIRTHVRAYEPFQKDVWLYTSFEM